MKVLFAAPDLKPSTEMDVFWEEPVDPDDPIFAYNVLATPHIAGSTDISIEGIMKAVRENTRRVERGEEPLYQKQSG